MKKLLTAIVLCLLLAVPVMAHAVEIPAPNITITAQAVDYVSAMAGIAKPVSKTYTENERYALLVTVDVPAYLPLDGLDLALAANGCTVDDAGGVALASGSYIIYGTVLVPDATVNIDVIDKTLEQAQTAEQLWAAVNGDRSVSVTAVLNAAQAVQSESNVPIGIPKTGDRTAHISIMGSCVLALCCLSYVCGKKH